MHALTSKSLNVIACVWESAGVSDLAITMSPTASVVVRCVDRASEADCRDLETMIAQGDFIGAAIVYTAEDQPHLSSGIPAYPLSRVDELAASLARKSTS